MGFSAFTSFSIGNSGFSGFLRNDSTSLKIKKNFKKREKN